MPIFRHLGGKLRKLNMQPLDREKNVGKSQLKIQLRPIDYDDTTGLVEKVPEGYNWTMTRRIYPKAPAELDDVLRFVEQSYKDVL